MYRHIFRIAVSILICFLIQIQGADKYTDENRPYEFGFEVEVEGMKQQHRHEEKDKDGIIKGEFGFITADDVYHVTVYATDKDGHFKILSMKNIHLKSSTASAGNLSSSPRQGHALSLPASTKPPVTAAAAPATLPAASLVPKIAPRIQTQAVSTFTNNAPPQNNAVLQTSFTPVPEPSPVKACSGCSVPTSPKPPPVVPQVNNFNQNQQTLLAPAPPSLNKIQPNRFGQPISYKPDLPNSPNLGSAVITNGQISPQQPIQASYTPGLSNEQVNPQTPSQSAYPVQATQSNQKANPRQASSGQNYPNQPSQSLYPPRESPNNAGPISQQPIQSSYPQQIPSAPNNAGPTSQQPNQSFNQPQEPSISNNARPISQQPIQSSYPQQVSSVRNNAGIISQQPSQSSYPPQEPSVSNNAGPISQQPIQSPYHQQAPTVLNKAGPTSQQPSQSVYPQQVHNYDGVIPQQPGQSPLQGTFVQSNPIQVSQPSSPGGLGPAVSQPNYSQQGGSGYGEREPKQYNGPKQSKGLGEPGPTKPKLVSVDMQIVDRNTDIHALQPGEKEGLPDGLSEHDMSRLLYTFNYTVGFHGHFEEGYENGVKKGYYYVTGRNGVRTRIDYVADGTGFHPKVSQEVLDLLSDDVPKPETEKDAKYGLKSYEFKWLYFPVGS